VIIDGHAHACGDLLTPDGILRTLDGLGVETVVLVPGEYQSTRNYALPPLARVFPKVEVARFTNGMTKLVVRLTGAARYLDDGNELVSTLTRSCPGRVLQFLWVMLHDGFDPHATAARYHAWRFRGLKVHQCWERFDVRGRAFGALADFAAAHDLPIFIHPDLGAQPSALAEVASARQETIFIVGHLVGLKHFIRTRRSIPNIYFDCSCPDIVSDARLRMALDHFGAGHLILGSDSPYGRNNLARSIQRVRQLDIPGRERELILGGNLARLLRLDAEWSRPTDGPAP
jgi:predicted TIM-barrel fold metal-dependent hydrolase